MPFRFYITVQPSSDTAEADTLENAIGAARQLWEDARVNVKSPEQILIELKEIPDWDKALPRTDDPWA